MHDFILCTNLQIDKNNKYAKDICIQIKLNYVQWQIMYCYIICTIFSEFCAYFFHNMKSLLYGDVGYNKGRNQSPKYK